MSVSRGRQLSQRLRVNDHTSMSDGPGKKFLVELCGPFPETEQDSTHILVLTDNFTR